MEYTIDDIEEIQIMVPVRATMSSGEIERRVMEAFVGVCCRDGAIPVDAPRRKSLDMTPIYVGEVLEFQPMRDERTAVYTGLAVKVGLKVPGPMDPLQLKWRKEHRA